VTTYLYTRAQSTLEIPIPQATNRKLGSVRLPLFGLLLRVIILQIAIAIPAWSQDVFFDGFEYGSLSGGTIISNPFLSDPYNNSANCMQVTASGITMFQVSGITASSGQNLQLSLQVDTATAGPNYIIRAALFASNATGGAQNGYGIHLGGVGSGANYTAQIVKYNAMGLGVNPPTVLASTVIPATQTGLGAVTTNAWNRLLFGWTTNGSLSFSLNGAVVLTAADTQFAPGILASNGLGIWTSNNNANLAIDNIQITALPAVPNGAAALGYTKCVFNEYPVCTDIAPGRNGNFKWFNGSYFQSGQAPVTNYTTTSGSPGTLAMCLNSGMYSTPIDMSDGVLPVLPGAYGFYVEYEVKLSDNNSDHWPAVWAEAVEHCTHPFEDTYFGDPSGYERWLELDVDEGGFGPGTCSTAISWTGIWSQGGYVGQQNGNNVSSQTLDRTQWHTFGASYNPITSTVTWWLDGTQIVAATSPDVPLVAAQQHFYLILGSQTHGAQTPYTMYVRAVRAYVPPPSSVSVKPVIYAFTESAPSIYVGDGTPVTLTWSVVNAASVQIDQGVGALPNYGTLVVSPTNTTTWTLTASNSSGVVTQTVNLVVLPPPAPPTVAVHWGMDEGAGTNVFNSVGTNFTGTFQDTNEAIPTWSIGKFGTALKFSLPNFGNENTAARAVGSPVTNFPFMISVWVNAVGITATSIGLIDLLNENYSDELCELRLIRGQPTLTARFHNQLVYDTTWSQNVISNGWVHLVGVYESASARHLYANGVLVADSSTVGTGSVSFPNPTRLSIGNLDRNPPTDFFSGTLDEAAILSGLWTPTDVAIIYGAMTGLGVNTVDAETLRAGFQPGGSGSALVGGKAWQRVSGLAGLPGATGGSLATGNAYVVMDNAGNGMALGGGSVSIPAPLVYYPLDESSGTNAYDYSGNGCNAWTTNTSGATGSGAIWSPSSGQIGGALRFNPSSTSDYTEPFAFNSSSNIIANYPFTLAVWIKTSLINQNGPYDYVFLGDGTLNSSYYVLGAGGQNQAPPYRAQVEARNTTSYFCYSPNTIPDGNWHHIAGVFASSTNRTLYVDGVAITASNSTTSVPIVTSIKRFGLGALTRAGAGNSFNGYLDDVALWNVALTPQTLALINAMGLFEHLPLTNSGIATLMGIYTAGSGSAKVGAHTWAYATGLGTNLMGYVAGSTASTNGYVVLGADGSGVRMQVISSVLPNKITQAVILSGGHFQFVANGATGYVYSIQCSPALTGPWTTVTNITAGTDGLIQFQDPTSPQPVSRFYRTVVASP